MDDEKAGPGPEELQAALREFAALRVTPAALAESLGRGLDQARPGELGLIARLMREEKLTLGRAIAQSRRPPGKKPPAAREKAAAPAAPPRPEKPRRLHGRERLLILESPTKAKTIHKFLGGAYTVKGCQGHVRDMPAKGVGSGIGIDFQNNYQPIYVPVAEREKVIGELRTAVNKAGHVYLATDPDREGEAIAWHLKELFNLPDDQVSRVTFNAVTRSAVTEAIKRPAAIDMNLVNSQQGRRVLDRIVGYRLSPFLWKKVSKGLSAGRVQSVAVRLVVEREREIQAFDPVEFWRIRARLAASEPGEGDFLAELREWRGAEFVLPAGSRETARPPTAPDREAAEAIVRALAGADCRVREVEEREVKSRPAPPFITSTLQQAAATLLRLGAQRTMRLAQQLYEGVELAGGEATGLITYMRTDSTRIAPEAVAEAREYLAGNFPPPYLPANPNHYASRNNAQDAHEAIRPAAIGQTPERVRPFLAPDQFRLYELIWRRFLASQMAPAEYRVTTVKIGAGEGVFEAKGRRVLFDGHTAVSPSFARRRQPGEGENGEAADRDGRPEEEQALPALAEGQTLEIREIVPGQRFTQPPPRFNDASLIRELEKEGIGRPATYAPIVQTIQDRGYVRQENRRFFATRLGMAVTDMLRDNFPDLLDVKFTARMEADLDRVEKGEVDWTRLVDQFYRPFEARLAEALAKAPPLKGTPAPNGEKCPLCGAETTIRYSSRGAFLGCSRFPECSGTRELPEEGEAATPPEAGELPPCPVCGGPMLRKRSRYGPFLACASYPACKGTRPLARDGAPAPLPEIQRACEKCGKPMRVKSGRRGLFLACTGYPECRNAKPVDKDGKVVDLPEVEGEICPKCGKPMLVRMSRRGPFLSCSGYPGCRGSKPLPAPEAGDGEKRGKGERASARAEIIAAGKPEAGGRKTGPGRRPGKRAPAG
ncbi:MAG: type I DNA topoisomerase [Planctomycetota bacterium]|jgi:DNA topoisomerase-1|nr:type I DNA topoisomerase [Planctomycetota bacterium]